MCEDTRNGSLAAFVRGVEREKDWNPTERVTHVSRTALQESICPCAAPRAQAKKSGMYAEKFTSFNIGGRLIHGQLLQTCGIMGRFRYYFCKKGTPHSENIVCYSSVPSGLAFDSARLKPALCTAILAGATATPVQVRCGVAALQRGRG